MLLTIVFNFQELGVRASPGDSPTEAAANLTLSTPRHRSVHDSDLHFLLQRWT